MNSWAPIWRSCARVSTRFLRLIFIVLTGCYTIQTAQREDLQPLETTHDDHVGLFGPNTGTRVAPHSPVRFHFKDGGQSPWLDPSRLFVNRSGVCLTQLSIDDLSRVEVKGLIDERRTQAAALAEALLTHETSAGFEVTGPGAALRAWVNAVRALEPPALPEETWRFFFRSPSGEIDFQATGLEFQHVDSLPDLLVDGVQWDEIVSLEVQHPDYGSTVAVLVLVPIAIIGGGNVSSFFASSDSSPGEVEALETSGLSLWKVGRTMPDVTGVQRLFSRLAIRRADLRGLVSLETGGALLSGQGSQLSLFGGVRLRDLFEVGFGLRTWWPNLFAPTAYYAPEPLGPVRSKYTPQLFATFRLGLNFDLDADRRVLVPLHFEGGLDFHGHAQLRIAWGLQFRIAGQFFVALRPFTPQYTSGAWSVSNWQFPSSIEFGSAL